MEYTTEQKKNILTARGYELMRGYCFSNPTDQDYENHFVSEEEVNEALKDGAKDYFWFDGHDSIKDLDDSWEEMLDDLYDELDSDKNDKVDAFLLSILNNKLPQNTQR